jgi:hypothetical protein
MAITNELSTSALALPIHGICEKQNKSGDRTSCRTDEIKACCKLARLKLTGIRITYNCFGMVQSDTSGQATLCQKPKVRNGELVELQTISDFCDGLGLA